MSEKPPCLIVGVLRCPLGRVLQDHVVHPKGPRVQLQVVELARPPAQAQAHLDRLSALDMILLRWDLSRQEEIPGWNSLLMPTY